MLVAISASGNSPNVIAAAQLARKLGGEVVGITGFDGGELRRISDCVLHVPSEKGEYGPVEDAHMILDHLVTSYLAFLSENA
jgi:D-sedoheptulose 7-phosphate isomerase